MEPPLGDYAEFFSIKQFPKEKPPDEAIIAPFLQIFNFKTFCLAEAGQGALSVAAGIWQGEWDHEKAREL